MLLDLFFLLADLEIHLLTWCIIGILRSGSIGCSFQFPSIDSLFESLLVSIDDSFDFILENLLLFLM